MISRKHRIPGREIPSVLSSLEILRAGHLVVKARPNRLNYARTGIIISRRFLPRASRRNRLKRRLFGLIDPAAVAPGWDVLILVKQ